MPVSCNGRLVMVWRVKRPLDEDAVCVHICQIWVQAGTTLPGGLLARKRTKSSGALQPPNRTETPLTRH